jgi:hypothetical protein
MVARNVRLGCAGEISRRQPWRPSCSSSLPLAGPLPPPSNDLGRPL